MADEKPWVGLWKKQNDFHEEHHIFCEIWDCDVCLNKYNENVFAQGKLAVLEEIDNLISKKTTIADSYVHKIAKIDYRRLKSQLSQKEQEKQKSKDI